MFVILKESTQPHKSCFWLDNLQQRKAVEHRRTPRRKREIRVQSRPRCGVRRCSAALGLRNDICESLFSFDRSNAQRSNWIYLLQLRPDEISI